MLANLPYGRAVRLQCIAHTLQLAVKDGLNDCRAVECAVEQVALLINSSHKSYKIKERLEKTGVYLQSRNAICGRLS
jgi:hypothetical protein